MSSGSSGRYQSRIFNFVHQQSRRLTEQLEHTMRYVQVATKWGVELILYPVYLLLQSNQSQDRNLYSKEPPTRLHLEAETPPPADTPIQNVLETVKNLPFTETTATSTPAKPLAFLESLWLHFLPHQPSNNSILPQSLTIPKNPAGSLNPSPIHPMVQGIATDLENRNLLLITAENKSLDILTPEQQAKLEDVIISEIANYWRCWRLLEVKKQTNLVPEIERLLAKLTGNKPEQTALLNPGGVIEEVTESKSLPSAPKALAFLDTFVAKWESNIVLPMQQRSREIIQVAQTQFNIFLYGKEQLAARGEITITSDSFETQTQNIPGLITAALNYFFGVGTDKKLDKRETHSQLQGKRLPHIPAKLSRNNQVENTVSSPDLWLTWDDLFGESETSVVQSVTPSQSHHPSAPKNLIKSYQNFVQQPQIDAGLVQQQKTSRNLTSTQKKSDKVTSIKRTNAGISQPSSNSQKGEISQHQQSTQIEAKPDWIETKATLVEYEKHILEQVLELLDRIILWLEEILVKMIKFFQGLWLGK